MLAVVEILKIQIKVIKCIKIRSVSLPLVFDTTCRSSGVCLNKHFGFRSRIDNISGIRQSSFPQHFFRTENNFARSLNATLWTFISLPMTEALCFSICVGEDGVWCNQYNPIARITFEIVNNAAALVI